VDALRSRVALTRIRCLSGLDEVAIARWTHVVSVERDSGRLHIRTDAPENILRRLLDADPSLSELEVMRAGLAEAFTELTRETSTEQEAA
jgi:ABC-2 type transport system ATP-binding protein